MLLHLFNFIETTILTPETVQVENSGEIENLSEED